jgi:hypothetical protein
MKIKPSFICVIAAIVTAAIASADTDLALGKPVTGPYYDQGSEVFPVSNITNGEFGDTGSPYNWSFWLTPQGYSTGSAVIDLGSVGTIDSFVLQDTHNRGYYDRGTDGYTIAVSDDDVHFTTVVTDSFTYANWVDLDLVTDTLASSVDARYVEFNITSIYGGNSGGLNELEVMGHPASSVPAPAAVCTAGIGFIGMLRRRRSR